MTRRILTLLTVLLPLAVPSSAAAAGDKALLSGYGGPGGGEQSVLGSKLLPEVRGNGSLRAATVRSPAGSSAPAPAGVPAPSGSGGSVAPVAGASTGAAANGRSPSGVAAGKAARGSGKRSRGTGSGATASGSSDSRRSAAPGPTGAAAPVASGERITYPVGSDAGTLPIGGFDALLLVLGLAALGLVATATWGLTRAPSRRPGSPLT